MPKRSSRKRVSTRTKRRRTTQTGSRKRRSKRSGTLGDIHTFKGIINAGTLSTIVAGTSTHLGGIYIFKHSDFPIIGDANTGLGASFDFVRLNRCRMEFLPRYNIQSVASATVGPNCTFLTALDEIPVGASGSPGIVSPSWTSQADEDTGVTEATAFDHVRITPDYLRGIQSVKETETYKKHVVHFMPKFYNNIQSGAAASGALVNLQQNQKKWINLNFFDQATSTENFNVGPDYYGPMFCFSNNAANSGEVGVQYDVKLHYSVSFRRLKGI